MARTDPPSALDRIPEIQFRAENKRIALFLDYDGTLTRIVSDPGQAVMPQSMRGRLVALSRRFPLALISGRDLPDLQRVVGIPGIFYAGSHGFDIAGPSEDLRKETGLEHLPSLDRVESDLRASLETIDGVHVERKRFSVAVHYRMVSDEEQPRVGKQVANIAALHRELRLSEGKKVFELQPDVDWHKGRAVSWMLCALGLGEPDVLPFYIGDDMTDEDAFKALRDTGIGIVVMDAPRQTEADYRLRDPLEVEQFLDFLMSLENQIPPQRH